MASAKFKALACLASVMHSYLKNNNGRIPELEPREWDADELSIWLQSLRGRGPPEQIEEYNWLCDYFREHSGPPPYVHDSTQEQVVNAAPAAPAATATEIDDSEANDCAPDKTLTSHNEDTEMKETIPPRRKKAVRVRHKRDRSVEKQASSACSRRSKKPETESNVVQSFGSTVLGTTPNDWMARTVIGPSGFPHAPAAPAAAAMEIDDAAANDCAPEKAPTIHNEDTEIRETISPGHSRVTPRKRDEIHVSSAFSKKHKQSKTEPNEILPFNAQMTGPTLSDRMTGNPTGHSGFTHVDRGGSAELFLERTVPSATSLQNASTMPAKSRRQARNRAALPEAGISTGPHFVLPSASDPASPSKPSIMDDTPTPEYINGKCSICSTRYKDRYNFERHVKAKHSQDPGVRCLVCDKSGRSDNIDQHIILKHTIRKRDASPSKKTNGRRKSCKSAPEDKKTLGQCPRCLHVDGPVGMNRHFQGNPNCLQAARDYQPTRKCRQSP